MGDEPEVGVNDEPGRDVSRSVSDSKPLRRTSPLAWGLGLTAVLAVALAGGWRLGYWSSPNPAGAVQAASSGDDSQARGTNATSGGQRTGQPPTRPPQLADFLPPARWRWWRDEAFQKEVGLSAAQVQRIDAMVKERENELAPFIKEYLEQRDALRKMALERRVTVHEFAVQAARFEALNAKLNESRNIMLFRMSRELTDEQYRMLQEARDRRASRGSRGAPPGR